MNRNKIEKSEAVTSDRNSFQFVSEIEVTTTARQKPDAAAALFDAFGELRDIKLVTGEMEDTELADAVWRAADRVQILLENFFDSTQEPTEGGEMVE